MKQLLAILIMLAAFLQPACAQFPNDGKDDTEWLQSRISDGKYTQLHKGVYEYNDNLFWHGSFLLLGEGNGRTIVKCTCEDAEVLDIGGQRTPIVVGVHPKRIGGKADPATGTVSGIKFVFDMPDQELYNLIYGPCAHKFTFSDCEIYSRGPGLRNGFKLANNAAYAKSNYKRSFVDVLRNDLHLNHVVKGADGKLGSGGEGISLSKLSQLNRDGLLRESKFTQYNRIEENRVFLSGDDPIALHGARYTAVRNNHCETFDGRIFDSDSIDCICEGNYLRYVKSYDGHWSNIGMGFFSFMEEKHGGVPGTRNVYRNNTVEIPAEWTDGYYGFRFLAIRDCVIEGNRVINHSKHVEAGLWIEGQEKAGWVDPFGLDEGERANSRNNVLGKLHTVGQTRVVIDQRGAW